MSGFSADNFGFAQEADHVVFEDMHGNSGYVHKSTEFFSRWYTRFSGSEAFTCKGKYAPSYEVKVGELVILCYSDETVPIPSVAVSVAIVNGRELVGLLNADQFTFWGKPRPLLIHDKGIELGKLFDREEDLTNNKQVVIVKP